MSKYDGNNDFWYRYDKLYDSYLNVYLFILGILILLFSLLCSLYMPSIIQVYTFNFGGFLFLCGILENKYKLLIVRYGRDVCRFYHFYHEDVGMLLIVGFVFLVSGILLMPIVPLMFMFTLGAVMCFIFLIYSDVIWYDMEKA
jgi:hypothetical protein